MVLIQTSCNSNVWRSIYIYVCTYRRLIGPYCIEVFRGASWHFEAYQYQGFVSRVLISGVCMRVILTLKCVWYVHSMQVAYLYLNSAGIDSTIASIASHVRMCFLSVHNLCLDDLSHLLKGDILQICPLHFIYILSILRSSIFRHKCYWLCWKVIYYIIPVFYSVVYHRMVAHFLLYSLYLGDFSCDWELCKSVRHCRYCSYTASAHSAVSAVMFHIYPGLHGVLVCAPRRRAMLALLRSRCLHHRQCFWRSFLPFLLYCGRATHLFGRATYTLRFADSSRLLCFVSFECFCALMLLCFYFAEQPYMRLHNIANTPRLCVAGAYNRRVAYSYCRVALRGGL